MKEVFCLQNAEVFDTMEIIYIPIIDISPNPFQPRKVFNKENLDELANSIKEYGVMQPVSVRVIGARYELVAGERRLRASKLAGLTSIPSIVVNINDQQSAILAIIENLQRQNLNYIEEALGFQNLIKDYGFTQDELADKIGKSQSTIANKLRILKLSPNVQKILLENDLAERHARALLKLEHESDQLKVLERAIKEHLTVKRTEELVEFFIKKRLAENEPQKEQKEQIEQKVKKHFRDIRLFTNTIKQAIDIMNQSGVDTDYNMKELNDGYEIIIKIVK